MDKDTRNRIQRATQTARGLLEQDFEDQLSGVFDIRLDGAVAAEPGSHLDPTQRIVRTKLVAAIEHHGASGQSAAEAVASYRREVAFTTLNRFVALKMLEARGLVQECISRGEQSSGFKEFCGLAPGLVQLPDHGYRLYIESLFDELSVQIRVLFYRRDAGSLLWPKRATLDGLLTVLNAPELAGVWGEDETLGWIYQYYNDEGERKRMREASAAPRNSRELAVRNQFFTPRYVVEFLTDNTLGRLWYEMTRGQTRLKEQCRYLVRRPTEIFLKPGENAPEGAAGSALKASDTLSQEERLRQPVHIPHRPLKDPREIRLLDPACGSMHFGLYAFDLFAVIYDEAWDIAQGPDDLAKAADTFAPFVTFAASFPDKAAFLREVPRLIVEHNLHGIDIDRRAVQIAGLSLWLRAQRAWHQADVKAADRPRITRSHIVCAEPMPGEKELLREFVDQQFPAGERPAFAFLLEKVFDRMTLAGEAGSLLRMEEEIRDAIAEARALAKEQAAPRQLQLLPGYAPPQQTGFNLSEFTDEQFWQAAEHRIYEALRAYAEQAENGSGFRRRLFADDAAQGFAFIDLLRKRYDVAVMNPPFGDASASARNYVHHLFPNTKRDLGFSFIERCRRLAALTGQIVSRTSWFLSSFEDWRKTLIEKGSITVAADLGFGVLDGAMVETVAFVYRNTDARSDSIIIRSLGRAIPDSLLVAACGDVNRIERREEVFVCDFKRFLGIPGTSFAYWAHPEHLALLSDEKPFHPTNAEVHWGLFSADDFRFLRSWTEVPAIGLNAEWMTYAKGGEYAEYFAPISLVVNWKNAGREIRENKDAEGKSRSRVPNPGWYFKAGLTYSSVTIKGMAVRVMPAGAIFSIKGPGIIPKTKGTGGALCGLLNSSLFRQLMLYQTPSRSWDVPLVRRLPALSEIPRDLEEASNELIQIKQVLAAHDEQSRNFFPIVVGKYESFRELSDSWSRGCLTLMGRAAFLQRRINEAVDRKFGTASQNLPDQDAVGANTIGDEVGDEAALKNEFSAADEYSYGFGCCFGRWDIRYANGVRPAPELPNPFAPLPVCPTGMLQGDDGLPISPEAGRRMRAKGLYPLDVAWDGILVDDPEHPLDIERRGHDALAVIWGDRTDAIQQEACELLGVPTLRDWFRRPAGFFADHLKRYSKSRRQAPIYWPLSTPDGRYTVWLYYHRFSKDTLYRALEQVHEKLDYEERKRSRLTADAGGNPGAAERAALADQESFVTGLRVLREELTRVAPLWSPDLNDGVILNYGPLWRMIGHTPWQKAVKERWDELVAGKYDWAHLAMHLWPERVVPKCAQDRSLAIAHGLEAVFWKEGDKGKWQLRPVAQAEVDRLIAERASAAVKDALTSLLAAPAPATGRGGGRQSSARAPVRRVPAAPRSGDDSPGSRPATGSAAPDPIMLDAVKQAIAAAQGATSKSEVLAATGLSDAQWNVAINALLAAGTVTKTGAARGTRYQLSATD